MQLFWANPNQLKTSPEAELEMVLRSDAEAYAEEKAKEAVSREREEIYHAVESLAEEYDNESTWGIGFHSALKDALSRIRSRGAEQGDRFYTCLKCRRPFKAPVHMLYCDNCVITEFNKTQPAPKLEKLERESFDEWAWVKVTDKLNECIDAIESLSRERA